MKNIYELQLKLCHALNGFSRQPINLLLPSVKLIPCTYIVVTGYTVQSSKTYSLHLGFYSDMWFLMYVFKIRKKQLMRFIIFNFKRVIFSQKIPIT